MYKYGASIRTYPNRQIPMSQDEAGWEKLAAQYDALIHQIDTSATKTEHNPRASADGPRTEAHRSLGPTVGGSPVQRASAPRRGEDSPAHMECYYSKQAHEDVPYQTETMVEEIRGFPTDPTAKRRNFGRRKYILPHSASKRRMEQLPYIYSSEMKNDRRRNANRVTNLNSDSGWELPPGHTNFMIRGGIHVAEEGEDEEEETATKDAEYGGKRRSESTKKTYGRASSRKAGPVGDVNINIITIKNQVNKNYVFNNYK